MKIVRWILLLPVALVVFGIAQLITAVVADKLSWFWSLSIAIPLGGVIAVASCFCIRLAPNPKIGATIILTLFLLFEAITLIGSISHMSAVEIIIRLYTDAAIIVGALVAAKPTEAAEV